MALPIGTNAQIPELLGPGRQPSSGVIDVPRHSPTIFNVGLLQQGLFWDSRIERVGNGIATPDGDSRGLDPAAGSNLLAAQAGFPVTSAAEMKTAEFEPLASNAAIRNHLSARLGGYGIGADELSLNKWFQAFQQGFGRDEDATTLVTFTHVAIAIAAYERSLQLIDSSWNRYLSGELTALTDQQKQGAELFFSTADDGGAGCVACHSGPAFTDEQHHVIAFPQFGPGKGDGNHDDFGRERVNSDVDQRYAFRTPSLLNVALTAPYGHAGSYADLDAILAHYNNPRQRVNAFLNNSNGAKWRRLIALPTVVRCFQSRPITVSWHWLSYDDCSRIAVYYRKST